MGSLEYEDVLQELNLFGAEISGDDVFDRIKEICQQRRLGAGEFAAQWMAFTLQAKAKTSPTLETLNLLDQWLSKKASSKTPTASRVKSRLSDSPSISTAEHKKRSLPQTPTSNKRLADQNHTPKGSTAFSCDSFSPTCSTPSARYDKRQNQGEVIQNWGDLTKVTWKCCTKNPTDVHQEKPKMEVNTKYMFQKFLDKIEVLSSLISDMEQYLKDKHEITELCPVGMMSQEPIIVIGRVCCEMAGRLNAKSVVLQGSIETSRGATVRLDLSKLSQFSLFPGQVIAVQGTNPTGRAFVAEKIFENTPLPLPSVVPPLKSGALSVCVVAGPYCTSDGLSYQPFEDFLSVILQSPPDVCVMMGPFLDSKQTGIEDKLQDATFDEIFQNQMHRLYQCTADRIKTKFVIVPSSRDLHHDPVYPQPPFRCNVKKNHFLFVSDPCTVNVAGVVIGITSTDVLFHLGAEETGSNCGSDRLGRLAHHILSQHSFYPLEPAPEELNIDWKLFDEYCHLEQTPHILLMPSDLKGFVKDVSSCLCVNPGRLTKGNVGGTYARFVVNETDENTENHSLCQRTTAAIFRI